MRKVITVVFVTGMTFFVSWAVAKLAGGKISEYIFFASLLVTVVIRYFTSRGGLSTNNMKLVIQSQFKFKVDDDAPVHMKGEPSLAFVYSLVFTILTAVYTVFMYWSYF